MDAKYLTLFGALTLAAAGCTGEFIPETGTGTPDDPVNESADAGTTEPEDPSGEEADPSTARALFEQNVYDIVTATCNPAGACHATQDPAFVAASQNGSYDKIAPYRDQLYPGYTFAGSPLITNGQGGHYNATYSADDLAAIEAWLSEEALEADAGGGQVSALAVWSGCMNLDDWNAEGVAGAWSNKDAQGQGNCEACHNLGADGFIASDQSERVFQVITENPAFMPSYFTLDATGQNVVINRARLEKVGNQLSPHEAHGAFDVNGNAMDALQDFYDLTKARLELNQCDPPRFPI